ncbi:hypothetical protein WOLCODRAFT_140390 [Wolfiporia cocos MD-104 SS10]|uniref:DUF7330 domain-containing protein n=1 Tax=Wolfiporia cocos (strain MD-104) TaxID=742152 RepID=A0A2H3J3Z4_WOLCO|nr:hypothetical protein WOLCODRAFT_140390 [Wolfiporia cocos MD-104 SS10]
MIIDKSQQANMIGEGGDPARSQDYDLPPPYDGVRSSQASGFSRSPATSSVRITPAPAQPPRRPVASPTGSSYSGTGTNPLQSTKPQTVNHISLFHKSEVLSGSYRIDPSLPTTSYAGLIPENGCKKDKQRDRSIEREHARNVRKAFGSVPGAGDQHSGLRRPRDPAVNAVFRTRSGAMNLDLAVVRPSVGRASDNRQGKLRGRAMLSTRSGAIRANLLEIQHGCCVDLDISTRSGSTTVFLPPSFDGALAIRSRSGMSAITLLPALLERSRIVRGTDRDMLLAVIPPEISAEFQRSGSISSGGDDSCVVATRSGKIILGIAGIDQIPVATQHTVGLAELIGSCFELGAKQVEVLAEQGARHLELMVEEGAKRVESLILARAKALETRAIGRGYR